MFNGIVLVNKIDELSKELGITRKEFANKLNLSSSTVGSWKSKNILPPLETLDMIADFFEVSVEWLASDNTVGKVSDYNATVGKRQEIRKRIYEILAQKTNSPDADNQKTHLCFFTNMPELTYRVLSNWAKGRINISEYVLINIAYSLGISVEYLLTGNKIDKNNTQFDSNDLHILDTAKRNLNDLFCLDNLTGKRRQLAKDMLNQLMELEHLEYVEKKKAEKKV